MKRKLQFFHIQYQLGKISINFKLEKFIHDEKDKINFL